MKKLVIICTILIIFIFGAKVVNAKAITNFSNGEVTYLANNMTEDNCTSLQDLEIPAKNIPAPDTMPGLLCWTQLRINTALPLQRKSTRLSSERA